MEWLDKIIVALTFSVTISILANLYLLTKYIPSYQLIDIPRKCIGC